MPFLENVLKPIHDDALGKLQTCTHSICQWVTLVCTPLPLSARKGVIEPPTKFSEEWHVTYRISIFRGGLLGKESGLFRDSGRGGRGGCSFYIKSKN